MGFIIGTARAFARSENGSTLVEYGLMVALIAVGALAAFGIFGNGLTGIFGATANATGNSLSTAGTNLQ